MEETMYLQYLSHVHIQKNHNYISRKTILKIVQKVSMFVLMAHFLVAPCYPTVTLPMLLSLASPFLRKCSQLYLCGMEKWTFFSWMSYAIERISDNCGLN